MPCRVNRPRWTYLPACLAVMIAALGVSFTPAAAQDAMSAEPPLILRRGFFKTDFVYRGGEPTRASGWISYSGEFEDLLGMHPAALAEAERAKPWLITGVVGSAGVAGSALAMLLKTISDANDIEEGQIDSDTGSFDSTYLIAMAGFGAITIVSVLKAGSHINRAVEIFNEQETMAGEESMRASLSLGVERIAGGHALGLRLAIRF